jgi:hypothetical protein
MADDAPGALLTASYPNPEKSAWRVSSKAHMDPDAHFLTGYSIGLQLEGVDDPYQLRDKVYVFQDTSDVKPHPEASVFVPDYEWTPDACRYVVIGGGFKVHWTGAGNLATASFPNDLNGWTVRSKDHEIESPACITAYAICLPREMTFSSGLWDRVYRVKRRLGVGTTSGPAPLPYAIDYVEEGSLLTGGGADAHWEVTGGPGCLLWCLAPLPQDPPPTDHPIPPDFDGRVGFIGRAKAHDIPDSCEITTYAISTEITRVSPV